MTTPNPEPKLSERHFNALELVIDHNTLSGDPDKALCEIPAILRAQEGEIARLKADCGKWEPVATLLELKSNDESAPVFSGLDRIRLWQLPAGTKLYTRPTPVQGAENRDLLERIYKFTRVYSGVQADRINRELSALLSTTQEASR